MYLHYLRMAWRHLLKQRLQTALSLASLVIGLGGSLLILLYVMDESRFDRQFPNIERVYRLHQRFVAMDNTSVVLSSAAVAPTLNTRMTGQAEAVRLMRRKTQLRVGGQELVLDDFAYADPGFLDFFPLASQAGDAPASLREPNRLVLSATLARRLFGAQSALGQEVLVDGRYPARVGAVLAEPRQGSHLQFSALAGTGDWLSRFGSDAQNNWLQNTAWTYLRLAEELSSAQALRTLDALVAAPIRAKMPEVELRLELMPVTDIHLHSQGVGEQRANGDAHQILVFSLVAGVILLVSLFNYVNMATAHAVERGKEVGLRKVLGARDGDLAQQFLLEPLLLTAGALALALLLVALVLPAFNALFDKNLQLGLLLEQAGAALALYLATALLAGLYPALLLARLHPLPAIKGLARHGRSGVIFRRVILFLQLCAGLTLVIWGGHTWLQMRHIAQLPTGYARMDRLLVPGLDSALLNQHAALLRQQAEQNLRIGKVAVGELVPTQEHGNFLAARLSEAPGRMLDKLPFTDVRPGYFQALDIPLAAGREFSDAEAAQAKPWSAPAAQQQDMPILINRLAARQLGYAEPDTALGQWLDLAFGPDFREPVRARIVGVAEDYLLTSVHAPPQPLLYTTGKPYAAQAQLVVHHAPGQLAYAVQWLSERWLELSGERLPAYRLLSDAYDSLHRQDRLRSDLLNQFAMLSLLSVSLGLVGVCSFLCQRRIKEIAIRKVLGASRRDLTWLIVREFLGLSLLANLAAWPLAWFATAGWLAGFHQNIGQSLALYLLASLGLTALTLLITGMVSQTLERGNLLLLLKHE
ncbi:MAG: ABC transporter permease [Gammaproteobacteria bacterium]|nr:ABC transporter permease [Gammaproteobacteria bacterium]